MFPDRVIVNVLEEHCAPVYGDAYSAAMDLVSAESIVIDPGDTKPLYVGISTVLPQNMCALVIPRSSWRRKGLLCMALYDPGFLDPWSPFVTNASRSAVKIEAGERVLQALFLTFDQVGTITRKFNRSMFYDRGGGVGSTGR